MKGDPNRTARLFACVPTIRVMQKIHGRGTVRKLIVILLVAPLLGACATVKPEQTAMWGYKKNPKISEALNIATAMGMSNKSYTMKDNTPSVKPNNYAPSAMRKVATVGAAVGSAAEGILSAGSAGLDIASIMMPTNADVPQNDDYIWIFLPASKASDIKDAAVYVTKAMNNAIYTAFAKQGFKRKTAVTIDRLFQGSLKVNPIVGKKCDNATYVCTVSVAGGSVVIDANAGVFDRYSFPGGAFVNNAPYFSPSKKAWFFRQVTSPYAVFGKAGEKWSIQTHYTNIGLNTDKFWRDVTKNLPWLWVYHGTKYAPIGPMIYHNGHVLRFIKPTAVEKTAAK